MGLSQTIGSAHWHTNFSSLHSDALANEWHRLAIHAQAYTNNTCSLRPVMFHRITHSKLITKSLLYFDYSCLVFFSTLGWGQFGGKSHDTSHNTLLLMLTFGGLDSVKNGTFLVNWSVSEVFQIPCSNLRSTVIVLACEGLSLYEDSPFTKDPVYLLLCKVW